MIFEIFFCNLLFTKFIETGGYNPQRNDQIDTVTITVAICLFESRIFNLSIAPAVVLKAFFLLLNFVIKVSPACH
jgi:hypothetical protein